MPRYELRRPPKRTLRDLSVDGWDNATLHASAIDWHSYSSYYRQAADALVDKFSASAGPDGLLLPILFLYRHYLEVSLKGLVADCADLLGENVQIRKRHDLALIWGQLRPLLERAFPGHDQNWLDRIGVLVKEFQSIDPTSESFRYPVGNDGAPLVEPGFQMSPTLLKDTMREIFHALDSAAG